MIHKIRSKKKASFNLNAKVIAISGNKVKVLNARSSNTAHEEVLTFFFGTLRQSHIGKNMWNDEKNNVFIGTEVIGRTVKNGEVERGDWTDDSDPD